MTTYRSAARKLKVARIAGEGLRRLDTGNTESSVRVVSLPDFAVKALSRPRGRSFDFRVDVEPDLLYSHEFANSD